jgi:hypothetical protein
MNLQPDIYDNLEEVRLRANRLAKVTKMVLSDISLSREVDGRQFIPLELPDRCAEFREARASVLEVIGYPEDAR